MINTQLISFNGLSPYYNNSVISTTRSAANGITEAFTNTQLLYIIAIVTAIASVLFGAYKLAMHLGYFSPKDLSENEYGIPTAPSFDEDTLEYAFASPSAPARELVLSESSPEMQQEIFEQLYPNFGRSS